MTLPQRLLAEFLGTILLIMMIVGSGIMGETLSQGNLAIALLANSLTTGAGLYVLIQCFGAISGAHFNPAVSFSEWLWKKLSFKEFSLYALTQISGAAFGVWLTHILFGQNIFQLSKHDRSEWRFFISEIIATCGLIIVISLSGKKNVERTPMAVALFITSAYWFTSSTSFANPAVTVARSLTDTFSGILWTGIPLFIAAQFIGAVLAIKICNLLTKD